MKKYYEMVEATKESLVLWFREQDLMFSSHDEIVDTFRNIYHLLSSVDAKIAFLATISMTQFEYDWGYIDIEKLPDTEYVLDNLATFKRQFRKAVKGKGKITFSCRYLGKSGGCKKCRIL